MAQIVNGIEPKFHVQRFISNAGGWDRYNRLCGNPSFEYEDPLDAAFSGEQEPEPAPPRRRRKRRDKQMTADEFRDARGRLGEMWGFGRPLTLTEFGRVLRLGGVRPDQSVRDYERGKTQISGPLSLLIELLLAGAKPRNLDALLRD